MNKFITKFKIASIINFILGLIFISIIPGYSAILIVAGIILLYLANLDINSLNKSKGFIIAIGIILIFTNFLAGIFVLIGYDNLTTYLKENKKELISLEKEKVDKEVKRIDLLLKLGALMIVISEVLVATTSWNEVSNLVKVIMLLLLGTLFIGLSIFSDKKLKIRKTTITYWLLGLSFYLFTFVAVCNFELFGPLFTYDGVLADLAYFITYLLATIFIYITHLKFDIRNLLYFVYLGIYISLYYFINYLGIDYIINIITLTCVSLIANLITLKKDKKDCLKYTSKMVSYFMIYMIFRRYNLENSFYIFIGCILNIVNLLVVSLKNDDIVDNVLVNIFTYIYIFLGVNKLGLDSYDTILYTGLFSLYSIYNNYLGKSNVLTTINQIIYLIGIICFYVRAVFGSDIELLVVPGICLLANIINNLKYIKKDSKSISYYLGFIPLTLVSCSVMYLVNKHYISISFMMAVSIISLLYAFIYTIFRNKKKEEYKVLFLISVIFNTICMLGCKELIPNVLVVLSSLYLFIRLYKDDLGLKILTYILLLSNIYIFSSNLGLNSLVSNLITLSIYLLFMLIVRKDKALELISNIFAIVPIYSLADYYFYDAQINTIIESILDFYILYLILKYFCKSESSKRIVSLIGIILIVGTAISTTGVYVGIYIGIVALILILIGIFSKNYKIMTTVGIIVTIINILYQLNYLWGTIPFWLYLLLGGLVLIGLVTYKELKK